MTSSFASLRERAQIRAQDHVQRVLASALKSTNSPQFDGLQLVGNFTGIVGGSPAAEHQFAFGSCVSAGQLDRLYPIPELDGLF